VVAYFWVFKPNAENDVLWGLAGARRPQRGDSCSGLSPEAVLAKLLPIVGEPLVAYFGTFSAFDLGVEREHAAVAPHIARVPERFIYGQALDERIDSRINSKENCGHRTRLPIFIGKTLARRN